MSIDKLISRDDLPVGNKKFLTNYLFVEQKNRFYFYERVKNKYKLNSVFYKRGGKNYEL